MNKIIIGLSIAMIGIIISVLLHISLTYKTRENMRENTRLLIEYAKQLDERIKTLEEQKWKNHVETETV